MKKQPLKWRKKFKTDISDKGWSSKIYKKLIKLIPKPKQSHFKTERRSWIHKKVYIMAKKVREISVNHY